jgi:antitoxin Phd
VKTADATEVKNHFGQFIESAVREPILIRRSGREVAVMLSLEDYQRLAAVEDRWWALQAAEAEKAGYLGPEASQEFVHRKLDAEA